MAPLSAVWAFDDANAVQTLVYDSSHLDNTELDQEVGYRYLFEDAAEQSAVEDEVRLLIRKVRDEQRRDVSVEFLTEERRLPLPNFDNYRGNPVIIAMLEHLAQTMGRETGGGALYFRNRIRDSLASDEVSIANGMADSEGTPYAYKAYSEFTLQPFKGDPFLAERVEYNEATITLRFSDEVPGKLVFVRLESGPMSAPQIRRELVLTDG